MLPPPEVLQNRYRLVNLINSSAMSDVYQAHDEHLGRDVAVKFLAPNRLTNPEITERFFREARTIARLSHPNIVQLYDIGHQENWHYLVMEFLRGKNLRGQLMDQGGRLDLAEALHITKGVLQALSVAHESAIIHRDIKPENIMLTPDGFVKLMDFGLALSQQDLRLTQDEMLLGTVFYMAPEVVMGNTADARTDLYAVGVMLYELLTSQPPFVGDEMMQVFSQILYQPPDLSHKLLAKAIRPILTRLLAKNPKERYASAEEAVADLPKLTPEAPTQGTEDQQLLRYTALEHQSAAVEAERRHLAGRLQGSVIEPLNLLLSQANVYEQTMGSQPQVRMAISVLSSLAKQALQQVRDLENNLYPVTLQALGLEAALETLVQQVIRSSSIQINLSLQRLHERLSPLLELALFRAVQELLEYSVTVTRASRIDIQLQQRDQTVSVLMRDNGQIRGGDPPLQSSRSRLEQLGAVVETHPGDSLSLQIMVKLAAPIDLTPRELEVLQQLARGMSNKEIAKLLEVSPRTVNYHLDNLYSKLGVNSRTEALVAALRQGFIQSDLFK